MKSGDMTRSDTTPSKNDNAKTVKKGTGVCR